MRYKWFAMYTLLGKQREIHLYIIASEIGMVMMIATWSLISLIVLGRCLSYVDSVLPGRSYRFYDKSISLFSPEGDIFQVEYADKAGENGAPLICIVTSNHSIIIGTPFLELDHLMDRRCIEKISKVEEGVYIATAGTFLIVILLINLKCLTKI